MISSIEFYRPGELLCSGGVGSSCFTTGTRRVNIVKNPVIIHEWGEDSEVFTTSGTYPWSLWHRYSITVNQVMVATVKVMTSTQPRGTLGSVVSLLAATHYQGNPDRNHKLWDIASTERYILHMQALLDHQQLISNYRLQTDHQQPIASVC